MSAAPKEHWTVDRRIALPTLIMLAGNLMLGVWLASSAYASLHEIDRRVTRLEASDGRQAEVFGLIADRLARIEERLKSLQRRDRDQSQ